MKTIARNAHRKIAALRETHTVCYVHELGAGFVATPVPADTAWKALADNHFARLVDNENGTLTVRVHSNRWYTLTRP